MRRSKKSLGSGDREYFNERRPVNVLVDARRCDSIARRDSCTAPKMPTNTSHHGGSVRVVDPEAIHFDVVEVARSRFVRHPSCDGRFPLLIPSGR